MHPAGGPPPEPSVLMGCFQSSAPELSPFPHKQTNTCTPCPFAQGMIITCRTVRTPLRRLRLLQFKHFFNNLFLNTYNSVTIVNCIREKFKEANCSPSQTHYWIMQETHSGKLVLSQGCKTIPPYLPLESTVDLWLYPLSGLHPKNKPFDIKGTEHGSGELEVGKGRVTCPYPGVFHPFIRPIHSTIHSLNKYWLPTYAMNCFRC